MSVTVQTRVLIARLGTERIALDVDSVAEVVDAPHVAPLPLMPAGLVGHAAHRGGYVSILDPGVVLGVPRTGGPGAALLLAGVAAALWVDDVEDVWAVAPDDVQDLPAGADRLGVLRSLLRRGDVVVAYVDSGALRTVAAATLRQEQMR